MLKNKELINSILSQLRDPFNFAGEIKYYPGRDLSEGAARIFATVPEYMEYLNNKVSWKLEFIVLCKSDKLVGFSLYDEKVGYTYSSDLGFVISQYQNPFNIPPEEFPIDYGKLLQELRQISLENLSQGIQPKQRIS